MKKLFVLLVFLFCFVQAQAADGPKPIKVFILAGQSNMEGKAKVSLLEYQAQQPAKRDLFKHLRKGDKWIERNDVWIKFRRPQGPADRRLRYSQADRPRAGVRQGRRRPLSEQVLLIKTAWGGRSLYRDFRSPSAGLPPAAVLDKMLAEQQKRKPDATLDDVKESFGASYRAMIAGGERVRLPT